MIRRGLMYLAVLSASLPSLLHAASEQDIAAAESKISQMIAVALTSPDYQIGLTKIDLARAELKTESTTFSPLQTNYFEILIDQTAGRLAARNDKLDDIERERTRQLLTQVVQRYRAIQQEFSDRADAIEQANRNYRDRPSYRRAYGYISRVNYDLAWTHYTLALITTGAKQRDVYLQRALHGFIRFTASGYRNHPIVADCFLGQALCFYEQELYYQAAALLEPITRQNSSADTYKRITSLRIQSLQALPSHLQVEQTGQAYFNGLPQGHKLDSIELGMMLQRIKSLAVLASDTVNNPYYQSHLDKLAQLVEQIYTYGPPWTTALTEPLREIRLNSPAVLMIQVQDYFEKGNYQQACQLAQKALKTALDAGDDLPELLADIRYTLTVTNWNLKKYRDMHLAALDFIRNYPLDHRAAEICTRAVQAGLKGLKENPSLQPESFLSFLELLETYFPDHPDLVKVPWYHAALLIDTGEYTQAETLLKKVPPDSPIYNYALYGLALASARQAHAAENDTERKFYLEQGLENLDKIITSVNDWPADQQAIQIASLDIALEFVSDFLRLDNPDTTKSQNLLDQIDKISAWSNMQPQKRTALQLRILLTAEEWEQLDALLEKVQNQPIPNDHMASALTALIKKLEPEYAADENHRSRLKNAYEYLLRHNATGQNEESQSREINIRRRYAATMLDCQDYLAARLQYLWLSRNPATRNALDVLRGLARANAAAGYLNDARKNWLQLSHALPKETDNWYEANYNLIEVTFRLNSIEQAAKLLDYFKLCHPDPLPQPWQDKFSQLAEKITAAPPCQTNQADIQFNDVPAETGSAD